MSKHNDSSGSQAQAGKVWNGKRFVGGEPLEPYTNPAEVQADMGNRRAAQEKDAPAKQDQSPAA